jgi:hypothetical protein
MKRRPQRKHNPVARALRSGGMLRPKTIQSAKNYRRHPKHRKDAA